MYEKDVGSIERFDEISNKWTRLISNLGHLDPANLTNTTIVSFKGNLPCVAGFYDPEITSDKAIDPTRKRFNDSAYMMREKETSNSTGSNSTGTVASDGELAASEAKKGFSIA